MQGSQALARTNRKTKVVRQDAEPPAAQPPAGPIADEASLAASATDMSDAVSDGPAPAVEDALSAPAVVPEPLANTSPQPQQSPSMLEHKDTGQDVLHSAELSGTLVTMHVYSHAAAVACCALKTVCGPVMFLS